VAHQHEDAEAEMNASTEAAADALAMGVAPVAPVSALDQQQSNGRIAENDRETAAKADATDIIPIVAAPDIVPVSFQNIANAYGDYTRKSMEQTKSFVEKLTQARSVDKALEIQMEFTKQAYETFVAEMQKIYGLHNELARQSFKPLERLVAKATRQAP
jgi:phasin family protein